MITESKIEELAQSNFEGIGIAELRECCKVLNISYGPRSTEAALKRDLQAVFGIEPKEEPKPVVKAKTGKPNLTSDGVWGGRMRDVTVHRNDETKKDKGFMLGWENMKKYYAFGKLVHLPWPLYEVLKNSVGKVSTEREKADEEGVVRTERIWEDQQKHPYTDHGDTPGTEHLPLHMIDYYQGLAKKMNNFAGMERRKLVAVMADFHGKERAQFLCKDKSDGEIHTMVLTHLGLLVEDETEIDIAA